MKIGFDAKRAFNNHTGLGNYSRTLLLALKNYFATDEYILFSTPLKKNNYSFLNNQFKTIFPTDFWSKKFPAIWRSFWIVKSFEKDLSIFHGLSNELPFGIQFFKGKKIVTIHDLIFEYYPAQYKKWDVFFYRIKFKFACRVADKIVAISKATKQDIVEKYGIEEAKIQVCYQSCDARFFENTTNASKVNIKEKYNLPENYFLSVGSIIERKNLLTLCNAFYIHHQQFPTHALVVIGKGKKYKNTVIQYLQQQGIFAHVHFLEDNFESEEIYSDLPQLYNQAIALVYVSIKEGFGIPILEAMASKTAVITSSVSSMKEAGGDAAWLVNPFDEHEIANALQLVSTNTLLRKNAIEKGIVFAQKFTNEMVAKEMNTLYHKIVTT